MDVSRRRDRELWLVPMFLLFLAPVLEAQNPTLENIGFHVMSPMSTLGVCPNESPPFRHWELRWFPGCRVPYEINSTQNLPAGLTPGNLIGEVDAAAAIWNAVGPAHVALFNNTAAGAPCQPNVNDRRNCIAFDPNFAFGNQFAVTSAWVNAEGVMQEADILLNPNSVDPVTGNPVGWQVTPSPLPNPCTKYPLGTKAVVTHEFGHFLGLGHPNERLNPADCGNDDAGDQTVMFADYTNLCDFVLSQAEIDGVNFLYTADKGDHPDPRYPTLVQDGPASAAVLSGVNLQFPVGDGPTHLYGIHTSPGVANRPRYQYEWLAAGNGAIDDHPNECEALRNDAFDDGVTYKATCGDDGKMENPIKVTVHVKTARDVRGNRHPYTGTGGQPMYINGWFDWDNSSTFEEGPEHGIGLNAGAAVTVAGAYTYLVPVPDNTPCTIKARFRLDWGEDVGELTRIDRTLDLVRGAAQFGEVEDHKIVAKPRGPIGDPDPPVPPPNEYCHPMGAIVVGFSTAGLDATISGICHNPQPVYEVVEDSPFPDEADTECMDTTMCMLIDVDGNGENDEQVCLSGPACVERGPTYIDSDGLKTIDTRMTSLNLSGFSHFADNISIHLAPGTESLGQVKQSPAALEAGVELSAAYPADSYFDVYFIVDSDFTGPSDGAGPVHVTAQIASVPPGPVVGDIYETDQTDSEADPKYGGEVSEP